MTRSLPIFSESCRNDLGQRKGTFEKTDVTSIVVTPVCPHALSSRPLVLKDDVRMAVTVEVREAGDEPAVFADGRQVCTLEAGDTLEIAKSSATVPLVELDAVNPYAVLTRKLGWSGSSIRP